MQVLSVLEKAWLKAFSTWIFDKMLGTVYFLFSFCEHKENPALPGPFADDLTPQFPCTPGIGIQLILSEFNNLYHVSQQFFYGFKFQVSITTHTTRLAFCFLIPILLNKYLHMLCTLRRVTNLLMHAHLMREDFLLLFDTHHMKDIILLLILANSKHNMRFITVMLGSATIWLVWVTMAGKKRARYNICTLFFTHFF